MPRLIMFRWVPADWLTQWANSTDNVPFPKDVLLCKDHGKLDPNKVTGVAKPSQAIPNVHNRQHLLLSPLKLFSSLHRRSVNPYCMR